MVKWGKYNLGIPIVLKHWSLFSFLDGYIPLAFVPVGGYWPRSITLLINLPSPSYDLNAVIFGINSSLQKVRLRQCKHLGLHNSFPKEGVPENTQLFGIAAKSGPRRRKLKPRTRSQSCIFPVQQEEAWIPMQKYPHELQPEQRELLHIHKHISVHPGPAPSLCPGNSTVKRGCSAAQQLQPSQAS